MIKNAARIMTGAAFVALMGLTVAGCGQQQAAGKASAAQTTPTTTTTTNTATPTANSNAPLLAVVSPAQEGPCLVTTQYQHGANVILRIEIFNPTTGQQLTNEDLSAVNVVLPDGTQLPAQFGTHEGGKIPFWVAHWTIPASYPTGQVNYTVDVQGSSRTVEQVKFDTTDPEAYLTVLKGAVKSTKG